MWVKDKRIYRFFLDSIVLSWSWSLYENFGEGKKQIVYLQVKLICYLVFFRTVITSGLHGSLELPNMLPPQARHQVIFS